MVRRILFYSLCLNKQSTHFECYETEIKPLTKTTEKKRKHLKNEIVCFI